LRNFNAKSSPLKTKQLLYRLSRPLQSTSHYAQTSFTVETSNSAA